MRIVGTKFWVITCLGVAGFAAYATMPRWKPITIPPAGSFRITDVDEGIAGGELLATPGGKIAIVEVDYQGPKEWVEVVVENWEGPTLVSTETLMRMKFGSDKTTPIEGGISRSVGPAFLRQRQIYSIWLDELPEMLTDGRNAMGKVVVGDPAEPNVASSHSALIDVRVYGQSRDFGTEWRPDLPFSPRDGRVLLDSQPVVIWQKSAYSDKDAGREPPYPDGATVSRMLLRWVDG